MYKVYSLCHMSTKYTPSPTRPSRVQELPTVTATELKHATADVLDRIASGKALAITRHDKPRAVLISVEHYENLVGEEGDWLAELHAEYRGMLDRMQEPRQKAAAQRLFEATPEELGAAAVRGAKRRSGRGR